jgi:hypothetical protein
VRWVVSVGMGVNVALGVDVSISVRVGVLDWGIVGFVPQEEINTEIRQKVSNDVFTMFLFIVLEQTIELSA